MTHPPLIAQIEKLLGLRLHPAPPRGDDPVSAVMPCCSDKPHRYALRDGRLAGLNLAGAELTDEKWQALLALPGFEAEHLEMLNLRDNRLQASPLTPAMTNLRALDLSANHLRDLTLPPGGAARLRQIWLYDNPDLASPPPEIVQGGLPALLQYFAALGESAGVARRLFEAKMLILGEGGAGKTSLARRLIDRSAPMPGEDESTRGIDIYTYTFRTPEGEAFLLRLWDFAGQDIYHATHQFFLTKRSLYVLVDSTRFGAAESPDSTFYYWFRVAELYGENSPLLLVQNEVADRAKDINYKGYAEMFPFIRGRFAVNIDKNRGLDALALAVAELARSLPHVGERWPQTWADTRTALEAMPDDYITYEKYIQTAAAQGVNTEAEAQVLSGFLHDLGVFLHYKDDSALWHFVILRNQWATDAVYKVLDHEKVKTRFGQFTQGDVDDIWRDPRYAFRKPELLALMVRFELCYALTGMPEPTWLATQLLPEEEPVIPWDGYRNLVLRYEFTFMPKGLLPRFIVRNNQYVSNIGHAWKYGVEMTCGPTAALLRANYATGVIEIRVNNRGDARGFLSTLADDMDRLLGSFGPRLQVEKMLPCPCEACDADEAPHFFKYSALRRRVDVLKKETIECEKSGLDVRVQPFLDTFFGKYAATKKIFLSYSHKDEAAKDRLLIHLKPLKRQGLIAPWDDRRILPGEQWDDEIKQALREADIVLFLLSPDAIASDYIWDVEIESAMQRHAEKTTRVVPIVLRDCQWKHTPLKDLQGLPRDGKPVYDFPDPDKAWAAVSEEIRVLVT